MTARGTWRERNRACAVYRGLLQESENGMSIEFSAKLTKTGAYHIPGTVAPGRSALRKAHDYNLDIKNPHAQGVDYEDPETLLVELTTAEADVISVRDRLEEVLAEALL